MFDAIDEVCNDAGDEWSLIPSQARLADAALCGIEGSELTYSSVPDALHHFSDVAGERRQLLPILTKSA